MAKWRNESCQHDHTRFHEQFDDLADTADIFHTVGFGKSKIPAQAMAHIVAIQHKRPAPHLMQMLFHNMCQG